MIRMQGEISLLILEPGSLRKLREGDPIKVNLSDFGLTGTLKICYCPDIEWLTAEIRKFMPIEAEKLSALLSVGLTMDEVDRGARVQ